MGAANKRSDILANIFGLMFNAAMNDLIFSPEIYLHAAHIEKNGTQVDIYAYSLRQKVTCPCCQTQSAKIHAKYWRHPYDLPCFDFNVRLHIEVRRFACANTPCKRRTFGEQFPHLLPYKARRTTRLKQQHLAIGHALGGKAGHRLSQPLRVPTSGDTLIREIRAEPEPEEKVAKVVGIDDWAMKRGCTYGTLIVDLETHQPIELLDSRDTQDVSQWLQAHPEIEIISRDRGKEYIKAATEGAPQAEQVADRWHLLKNLREAVETFLRQKPLSLQIAAQENEDDQPEDDGIITAKPKGDKPPTAPSATKQPAVREPETKPAATIAELKKAARHARRQERYDTVCQLHKDGFSQREIGRQLKISSRTVRKYIEADECPQYAISQGRYSKLTPWLPYIEERWTAGCTNALQLWREIDAQGFAGSRGLVSRWAAEQRKLLPASNRYSRQQPEAVQPKLTRYVQPLPLSARHASWLLVLNDDKLDAAEKSARMRLLKSDSDVNLVGKLTQRFIQMVKERQDYNLLPWLNDVKESGISALKSFANGIRADSAAVHNALRMNWSNGQTEGQVNRLKFIKRQMYGRAKFDLLRRRVLYRPT